ncbi:hypothetical protein [Streptomyces aidingensis]|uniref:FtsH ternary system domain-containing protein n=1 Tax=Streptomyces aidingensis TaxID=910347 RepID=A0A1I1NPW2_9ACTN|nr:hypothetical protein [Streptomyces aidingensis]SFC97538.1 hypothetical protein SAMN05421773_10823 [Streptomyces aidingensis]
MRVRVEFRFNAETGEVEVFRVDDITAGGRRAERETAHEEIAYRLGGLLDRRPGVERVARPSGPPAAGTG